MMTALAAIWAWMPTWLKLVLAAACIGLAAYQAGVWIGAGQERTALRMAAIKEATGRISNMEKSNANFRNKSARDRCLVIMRDSELPDSGCD
jgi:hypothetical protein